MNIWDVIDKHPHMTGFISFCALAGLTIVFTNLCVALGGGYKKHHRVDVYKCEDCDKLAGKGINQIIETAEEEDG